MSSERRRPGRPAHQPTDETRRLVADLRGRERPVAEIAAAVGVSQPTLRAYYAAELAAPGAQKSFPIPELQPAPSSRPAMPRAGRPAHIPTDETRERVEVLVAGGMRVWQIAAALGVAEPTLREHYAEQLDAGRSRRNAEVLFALYRNATEAKNVSAQKAWLKHSSAADDMPEGLLTQPPRDPPLGKREAALQRADEAARGVFAPLEPPRFLS